MNFLPYALFGIRLLDSVNSSTDSSLATLALSLTARVMFPAVSDRSRE